MEKQITYKSMELQNENEKLKEEKKEIGQLKRKIIEQEEEITKLVGENQEMKETMAIMKAYMKKKRLSIPYHVLPAELLNELFASLPIENAFGLLAKMPNGLLARNIQKMINCIREAMSNNKLNEKDCGPRLSISENGFIVKHTGPEKWNCVRAVLPIPSFNFKGINKATIAFYFEMQILHKENGIGRIGIGFCDEQFSLERGWPGLAENSAGFESKLGIWIENTFHYFQNYEQHFDKGDFVGIGIIHLPNSKMECFATWNGVLLRKLKLPRKFGEPELFSVANLFYVGNLIRVNFGKEEWNFKEFGRLLE